MRVNYDHNGGRVLVGQHWVIITDETLDKLIAARNEYLREQKHRGKR